jgi:CrcB protein
MALRSRKVLLDLALLALAGALGTLARFGLSALSLRWFGDDFPWGTLLINSLGCFFFGLVYTLADERQWLTREVRLILLTGFMGAFTTFSTFAFETGRLLEEGRLAASFTNVGLEVGVGMLCLFLGFGLGRWL